MVMHNELKKRMLTATGKRVEGFRPIVFNVPPRKEESPQNKKQWKRLELKERVFAQGSTFAMMLAKQVVLRG